MRIVLPILALTLVLMLTLHYGMVADTAEDAAADGTNDRLTYAQVIRNTDTSDDDGSTDDADSNDDAAPSTATIASVPLDR